MPFDLAKQLNFAIATTLTALAKEAADAVIKEARKDFTIRTSWLTPGNAKGIKALPASKDDLQAAVVTRADWLIPQQQGEKESPTAHLAVAVDARKSPTTALALRDLPRQLKGSFVIKENGKEFIAVRRGRGKNKSLKLMYRLIQKKAKLKHPGLFTAPVQRTVEKRFDELFAANLAKAISTAKR